MARDPRTIKPSEWRTSVSRITSRRDYVAELIRHEPQLENTGLAKLNNLTIKRDEHEDAYSAVNASRMTDAAARVLGSFAARSDLDPALIRTLVTNLTVDRTAVGYTAQIQGYDWL